MLFVKTLIELGVVALLIYGYAHEAQVIRFEQLLRSKRGRKILMKNIKEELCR